MQASPFLPLMFIASDPQTPSRQLRRNDSESSTALRRISASSSIRSCGSSAMSYSCSCGFASCLRVVAVDAEFHRGFSTVRALGGNQ